MEHVFRRSLPLAAVLLAAAPAFSQTFNSSLTGTVVDPSGAALPGATVELLNPRTAAKITQKSNNAGDFVFTEVPVGSYTVTISMAGFTSKKFDALELDAAKVTNLRVDLPVGAESTVVDVTANGVQVDTTSSALVSVISAKAVADMPMNGRNFTTMVKFAPGASSLTTSFNGSRITGINFQLDGADNVDPWLGIVASNQGGIASVAGGLIPIEAIEQFSMQAGGEADQGRNAGANQNMVIKSGTNQIHGDVFYFDRNEFFAALSPVAPVNSRKTLIRNHQGGFTLGGPIWKDHTFLFTAGEIQVAKANTAITDTVLTDAWVANGTALLKNYNLAVSQLSLNLYNILYPNNTKGGAAVVNNYFANNTSNYNSFNGIVKLDHRFSQKQSLSVRYLGTTGKQTAPTGSYYGQYFQTAPMHIHNIGIVHTYIFNSHLLNTVNFATNYFLQTFNDANQNYFPQANAGLNLGITNPVVAQGAPTIRLGSTSCTALFDCTGATQPSGRTDVTGHVTDNFHWTVGAHALKFGGEFRHSNVNQLYFSNARGSFNFDGTRGPWWDSVNKKPTAAANAFCAGLPVNQTSSNACTTQILSLADFLNGQPSNSNGAQLLQGNAQRVWTLNTFDFWAQDDFQVNRKLSLNYGVRYTVPGVIQAAANDIYQFVPGNSNNPFAPSAGAGFQKGYYPEYYGGIAPRVGFSFSPFDNNMTVVRGSYGIFYDFPAMSSWITGTTTNGGAAYAQNNPAGPDAAAIFVATNVSWQANVNPFTGAAAPAVGAFGVSQNFKMPRSTVASFNIEQQFSKSTLLTLGYVGTFGQHLEVLYDINQPVASGTSTANARPYAGITVYPNENATFSAKPLNAINQLNFSAASNYHSMQASLRQSVWKGLEGAINYTWSRSMDDASTNTTPMNSYNLHQDYGPSTFDARNVISGAAFYALPQLGHFLPRLTKGFVVNALYSYTTGTPISPLYSTDVSGTGELKDRPNWNGANPYVGGVQLATSTATTRTYRYLNLPATFLSTPAPGTYGNLKRDAFTGPTFKTVDMSLFKQTRITERVNSELRVELFNVFNFNNFANPTVNPTSSTFGIITNTRNAAAAPGIGFGEPFNIQFAFKLTF